MAKTFIEVTHMYMPKLNDCISTHWKYVNDRASGIVLITHR